MNILAAKRDLFIVEMARECEYSLNRAAELGTIVINPWRQRAESAARMAFMLIREREAIA